MPKSRFTILALNSGSSSLKFGLYRVGRTTSEMMVSGQFDALGQQESRFHAEDLHGNILISETAPIISQRHAVGRMWNFLTDRGTCELDAIGHRVVHGGPKLLQHCIAYSPILKLLEASVAFAPLHTPLALSVIEAAQEHFGEIPQILCFDTAFHAELPEIARTLPIPKAYRSEGVQRYGFHGLSCESIVKQLQADLPRRLIIAHLGNGASVTAVKDGKSIDTSMGLTPAGGVIMSTRTGELDPGVLLYLMRDQKLDSAGLEELVNRRSGLLGISGISGDMRCLHEIAVTNPDARLAIGMFCYSVRKQIAAMIAVLGGIDAVVFTGGIGENDAVVRAMICDGLPWFGNDVATCRVLALPSQEEDQIARHTSALLLSHLAKSIDRHP